MYQVLLVEDDVQICEVITEYFHNKEEMQLTVAHDGEAGLACVYESEYDLILMDVMMPRLDGFGLCKEIRKDSMVPIIFLTARGREEDVLSSYDLGCDDYVVKPFSLAELYAKSKALLNRTESLMREKMLQYGDVGTSEELLNKKHREDQVLRAIKTALKERTFQVFYQPIYSVEKQRYTAAEALVRMSNTKLGFISPEEFIPIAERNGMILEIGEFVFRTVCEFMVQERIWEKGIENIHVNLSVVQCMQERLAQNFLEIMKEYDLPCNRIHLEVTETVAVVSSKCLNVNMHRLIENGVQFALDDYGTGFSNATSLVDYPYDIIKIDKGVVWAAMENDNAMKVLSHSVDMIKSLNKNIVAEGVETLEQANQLKHMGCDYFQGYYYSKPVSGTDFVSLLGKKGV